MPNGAGLNTVGLFVRTTGSVVARSAGGFTIGDSIGLYNVDVKLPAGVSAPAIGKFAIVTGIVSTQWIGSELYPTLKLRNQNDLQVL